MNRNPHIFLIAALAAGGSFLRPNLSAMCPKSEVQTTTLEVNDVTDLKRNLPDQAKKDLQTRHSYFEKVKIGKTTKAELLRWFANLQIINPNGIPTPTSGSDKYISTYSLPFPNAPKHRYYYSRFTFQINQTTKMVQSKENGIFYDTLAGGGYNGPCLKPVIYLYPTKEQDVSVRLHYAGEITVSYPHYDPLMKGWNIRAFPDGKIINKSDKEEYSYIFWEGSPAKVQYDLSEGFVVEGDKSDAFLRDTLRKMGLTPREYNEFIVFWFPKLKTNKYNLVHFSHEKYEDLAKLEITPKPDSILRVFMVYKPLTEKIAIKPQAIPPFTRTGFTVIEWGGTELTAN